MTAAPTARLQAFSRQLVEGIPSEGTFENLPKIRHVAGDSAGQRCKGKVVIVTGKQFYKIATNIPEPSDMFNCRSKLANRDW